MTQRSNPYFWKRVRLGCFFLGVIISIFAWFIDRAPFYPAVLRVIFPEYAPVKSALTILGEGEKAIVPINHPGAQILLRWWKPSIPDTLVPDISGICRSTGVFNIITGVHRYELRLCTHNNSMFLGSFA